MLSQECPDDVFFNSKKSDLEGWMLPHVSSCMVNTLGENFFLLNTEITKSGCSQDIHFFAYSCQDLVYTRVQN